MKNKIIGCVSTMNEIKWLGIPDHTDSVFLDYDLHARPVKLHEKLDQLIKESQDYDLIILTYNRCSRVLEGLVSPRVPLLVPRTHDCIGLLLGSHERHMQFFQENPGTYYFSQGWLDYGRSPYAEYLEYDEKYGKETARKLMNTLYGSYRKAVLIITPGMRDINHYRRKVGEIADFFGWETGEVQGDISLLASLVQGKEAQDSILVAPGTRITERLLSSQVNVKKRSI